MDDRQVALDLARNDFYFYARWMFLRRKGFKWQRAKHHKRICDALNDVFYGRTRRLIINLPPRYSKTELAVVNWVSWCMGREPDSEFIHLSYSAQLAINNSWQCREVVAHEAYKEIFPDTQIMTGKSASHEWRTTRGGVMYATGSEGTITGYGAGKVRPGFGGAIIIDDPHKASEAHSDTMRQNVIDNFSTTIESRVNSPDTPIILIMQRLHEKDLSGHLLAGGNGEEWTHLCVPAIDDNGEALWPEKHDLKTLRLMEETNKYRFAGQYQQRPAPLGGGIIKGAWFRRYKVLPKIKWRRIYGDTAQKTKERNDYTVFECWGLGEDGKAYLLDLIKGKWEAPDLKRRAMDFWNKHKALDAKTFGALRGFGIEDKASGTGLIQDLRLNSSIPVSPIERTVDKLTRVMDVVSYIEAGHVCIPEDAPFVSDFIHECEGFTPDDSHEHDDQIDPMCDAINELVAANSQLSIWGKLSGS